MVKSNILFTLLVAGLLAVCILLALNPKPINVTTNDAAGNAISVTGNSELTVQPDKAELYIMIDTTENTAQRSKDNNADIADDVMAALKEEGVKKDDIETTRYYIQERFEWNSETRKSESIGYETVHVLKVTTTDLSKVGSLIDVAVDAGANGFERISFTLSKELQKEANNDALIRASQVAEDKAKTLATTLGVRLGKVKAVSESNTNFAPYDFYPRAEMAEMAAGANAPTQISPENIEVRAYVGISYEIK